MTTYVEYVEELAKMELADEEHRAAVEFAKACIRARAARRRWWHVLIPFTVTFKWRD